MPSGPSTPRQAVYLSSIEYMVGEQVPISALPDPLVQSNLPDLLNEGLVSCRVSDVQTPQLASLCATRSVNSSKLRRPDAIIYASESPSSADVWNVLLGGKLPDVTGIGVSGNGCGNLAPALRIARALIQSERLGQMVIVTSDRVDNGTRYQTHGTTVLSDGAASCLVSASPPTSGPYCKVLALSSEVRADFAPADAVFSMETISDAISMAQAAMMEELTEWDFERLITGNYGATTREFLAMAAGLDWDAAYCPSIADFGHCFSADILISLSELLSGPFDDGERILLMPTSSRSWSLIAVECCV